jgi:hypothetical protein
MTDGRDAETLEVTLRQIEQQLSVHVILAKCRLVLFKTERLQPVRDVQCALRRAVNLAWLHQPRLSSGSMMAIRLGKAWFQGAF